MKKHIITLFFFLGVSIQVFDVSAAQIYFDDFNDGLYTDSWNIDWSHSGNPSGNPSQQDFIPQDVICNGFNCYLEGHTAFDPGYDKSAPFLYIDNPTQTGQWQMDSQLKSSQVAPTNFLLLSSDHTPYNGDYYGIKHTPDELSLYKNINNTFTTLISINDFGGKDDIWHTIRTSRSINGEWKLYADDLWIGSVVDNSITDLSYLMIGRYGAFDNILVSDDISIPVPEPYTYMLLGCGLLGIFVYRKIKYKRLVQFKRVSRG